LRGEIRSKEPIDSDSEYGYVPDNVETYANIALAGAALNLLLVWIWPSGIAFLMPVTAGLILLGTGISLSVLIRRGRITPRVLLLNCVQIPLFALLHAQIHAVWGKAQYACAHPPAWYDWLEMVCYYGLKAADIIDILEEYDLLVQHVRNTGLASGLVILGMNLVLGIFLVGALASRLQGRTSLDTAWTDSPTLSRLMRRLTPAGLGLVILSFWVLFWKSARNNPYQFNTFSLTLWPAEQVLRTLDIGDAFVIFGWRLHTLNDSLWLSTLAICFRGLLSFYIIEGMGLLYLRLTRGWGGTVSDLGDVFASRDCTMEDRRIAARALCRFGPDAAPALPQVIEALSHGSKTLQVEGLTVLMAMGQDAVPDMIPALAHPSQSVRDAVSEAVRRLSPCWSQDPRASSAIDSLLDALIDADIKVRHAAREALKQIDPNWPARPEALRSIPVFIAALASDEDPVRAAAAEALGCVGPPAGMAVFRLIKALVDEHGHVRFQAEQALDRINPAWPRSEAALTALPHLIKAAENPDREVRGALPPILNRIGPPAIPHLLAGLKSPSEDAWEIIGDALAAIGPEALPPVIQILQDGNTPRLTAAIVVVGRFGSAARAAIPELTAATAYPSLRPYAEMALNRINR